MNKHLSCIYLSVCCAQTRAVKYSLNVLTLCAYKSWGSIGRHWLKCTESSTFIYNYNAAAIRK